jgi:hypothetical protein
MKRPEVNISTPERVGRMVIGGATAIAGAVLVGGAGSAFVAVLYVLLVLAGLDLVVTGAAGFCPLYKKLGHVPRSLRSAS